MSLPLRGRPLVVGAVLLALAATGNVVPSKAATCAPAANTTPQGEWLDGDTHVHTDHSSDGSGPRQGSDDQLPGNNGVGDQIGQGERMGLDFMPLTDHRTYDQQWDPAWTSSSMVLIPGEEANGSPHATVHGAIDQVPDGPNPSGSAGFRHFQQSIWDVHAQDANWGTAHPDDGEVETVNPDGTVVPNTNANAVDVDVVEIMNAVEGSDIRMAYAENRWNAGYRFGVVAASDSHFKELWPAAGPGQPRTRVFAASATERGIVDGLRAGHTSISQVAQGAAVTLLADADGTPGFEAMGGDEIAVTAGTCLRLRVSADKAAGLTVRIVRAPGGAATAPLTTFTAALPTDSRDVTLEVPAGTHWFRADIVAPDGRLIAVASPVFTSTDGPAVPQAVGLPEPLVEADGARPVIETPGRFTGFADIAVANGVSHIVAETHTNGVTKVAYAGVDGVIDLAPASKAARFPRVAATGDDVWVTWEDERSGQAPHRPDVYLRHSGDAGRTWDPEQRLTAGTARAIRPAIAVDADGRAVVAWSENRSGAFDVFVHRGDGPARNVSAAGKVIDPGMPLLDSRSPRYPHSLFPSLAVAPNGDVTVAFTDNRTDIDPGWTGQTGAGDGTTPDNWEVLVATLPAGGTEWVPLTNASTTPGRADRLPSIAYSATGELVVAWESKELKASGAGTDVRTARSTNAGTTWSAATPLSPVPQAMHRRPRTAVTDDGRVQVVWYDTASADWRYKVRRSTMTTTGWTDPEQLSGTGNATFPAVSLGRLVFTSDRAASGQRDRTSGVYAAS